MVYIPRPLAPPAASAVTSIRIDKKTRWACRACGRSHSLRTDAETCCREQVLHPPAVDGGELILPGHRTHEQVIEQLEARMQELEKQAKAQKAIPPSPYSCADCKWRSNEFSHHCAQPLVKGFDINTMPHIDWQLQNNSTIGASGNWPTVALCGREKALWEPKSPPPLTRWQHLFKALFG